MNSNKNMKIYLIFTLVVMFFCCPQIYAYYSKNDSKSVTIGTKDLIITGSTSATTYAADSNGVVSIPVTIKNNSGFAVNYNLTLSNTNLKFNDGKTVYSGTIAANTTSTVTLKIVEVNPLGTENTDIDMAVTGPYTKTIDIGSYLLTYDLTPPSCSMSISGPIKTSNTSTLTVTCTDASGVKTTSLPTYAISLSNSLGTLSNPQATAITNGYKYTFTYTAGSNAGTETFTLLAGKVSDSVNNKNTSKTATLTIQRDVKITFNINGASSFTYGGTKYTSTQTLTVCTLSSETTCSVTMPTIAASTNTPTVIGWSTAAGTHTATYTSGQTVSISNDLNLYAQTSKSAITRKATFSCNGGTGSVAEKKCTIAATYNGSAQGTSCSVSLPTSGCTYDPWEFQGWNISSSATTGVTGNVSISSDKSYYAIWKKEVCLNINANGCTTSSTQTCTYLYNGGTTGSFEAPSATVKSGWTLMGYGSGTSSTSATSIESGTITISSIGESTTSLTRYYVCQKAVTINFKQNGCTTADGKATTTLYNGATTASVKVPTKELNNGWANLQASTSSNATSGTGLDETISVSVGSASASANAYYICRKGVTVTFKANGCTSADGKVTKTLYNGATSTSVTVPTVSMINNAWSTLGASTSASSESQGTTMGSSMSITVGSSVSAITRYYNCEKEVGIDFYSNYCTTDAGFVKTKMYNGATNVTVSMPTDYTVQSGRTIKGVAVDSSSHTASSSVTVYIPSNSLLGYANFICTRSFTTTFKANGCATGDKTVTQTLYSKDDNFDVSVPEPDMKTGWTNNGAATTATATSGSKTTVNVRTSGSYTNATFYYTCSKPDIELTANFSCNGGTGTVASDSCILAGVSNGASQATQCTVTLPSSGCSMSGFEFIGWNVNSNGTTGGIGDASITSDKQYYAIYKKEVSIAFKANSCGTTDGATRTLTIYNGATSGTVTVPVVGMLSGWNSLGASASTTGTNGTGMGSSMTISGITSSTKSLTRYYNCYKDVTVTFSANGCTTASKEATMRLTNGEQSGSVIVPSATKIANWTTLGASSSSGSTSSGTAMNSSMTISGVASATTSVTRYYNCKKDVTVTFNANGCTTSNQSKTMTVYNGATSSSVVVPSATLKDGWKDLKASTSSSATSGTAVGGSLTISGLTNTGTNSTSANAYYICKKDKIKYTVSFNTNIQNSGLYNASATAPNSVSCEIEEAYNGDSQATTCDVTMPTFSYETGEWDFYGWGTSSGSTSGVDIGETISISSSHTRYATWQKTMTVTFKANGCTTGDKTVQKTIYNFPSGFSVTVPSASMNTGWTSLGVSSSSSSTSQGTAMGSTLSNISVPAGSGSSKTYYYNCVKEEKELTAKFSCNAGSGTVANDTCTIAAVYNGASQATSCTVTLPTSGCTLSGWNFLGWNISSSGQTGGKGDIPISEDKQYFAIFKKDAITRSMTYDCNGGTGSMSPSTCTIPAVYNGAEQDTYCTVSYATNACTYSGWNFQGWNSSSSATGGVTSGVVALTSNQTRYAVWKKPEKTISISYNCTEGSGSVTSTTCTIPAVYNGATQDTSCSMDLAANECTFSGWKFNGWGTYDGATSGTSAGTSVTVSSSGTRYATWKKDAKKLSISYNCTEGSGSVSSTTCTIPAVYNGATQDTSCSMDLAANECTFSGWKFNGWGTYDGATSGTSAGTSVTVSSSGTRYATWKKDAITYTAKYSCNGGSGGVADDTCTIPAVYNGATQATSCDLELPNSGCSMSGFEFLGWNVNPDATTGGKGGSLPATSNKQYYAIYKKNSIKYTISFNANGGTGSTGSVSCTIPAVYNGDEQDTSCSAILPNNGYTYSGWTFNGWGTGSSSISGTAAGGSVTLTSNMTRYATWKKTFVLTCSKGANVSSIGATSRSCSVYNGDSDGCTVYLPTITANSGYTSVGWGSSSGATSGTAAGSAYTLTASKTLYANATDQTAPTCGDVTGAGSSSSWAKSRTITVACNETSGSGCSQTSFSKTVNSGTVTTTTIQISDKAGNTANCTVNAYVDAVAPSCGTITGAGTSWAPSRTITVGCSETSGSGCSQTSFSKTVNSGTVTTTTVSIADKAGNTRNCTVNAYVDAVAPSCGTVTGAGSSSSWATSRTVSVGCSDTGGSGCTQATYQKSFTSTATTGTITIMDAMGNERNCTVNVYVDKTGPDCGTVTGAGTSWTKSRTISVACSDDESGCVKTAYQQTFSSGTATTKSIYIYDAVGNSTACTVNAYIDNNGPTCGTITGASTTWTTSSRNISVACSDSGSGCTQTSYSKSFTETKVGTITLTDEVGNTTNCSVDAYADITPPSCEQVTGASTSWITSGNRDISVGCSDSVSGCTQSTFSYLFMASRKTGTITIKNNAGLTRDCTVNVYIDTVPPTCGTVTNASTSWRNTTQTLSVGCSDSVSGCSNATVSKSFSNTGIGTITISDAAGNTKDCSVNAYVDTSKPSITCTVNSGGTSGVSATVSASDGVSGLSTNPSGSKTGLKSSTTYTAKNGAGLTASCTVTVTKSVSSHTKYTYKCTKATWGAGSQTTVSSCTARTQSTANSSNYAQYWTCSNQFGSVCTNAGLNASGCYYKTTYTRNGCSTYSSSASNTSTGLSSCSASSNNYYKYTCSTIYTYSGSA